jgi:hypothetical protein
MNFLEQVSALNALMPDGDGLYLTVTREGTYWAHLNDSIEAVGTQGVFPSTLASGDTPEDAVGAIWGELVILDSSQALRIRIGDVDRTVRWNGSMWADVTLKRERFHNCCAGMMSG